MNTLSVEMFMMDNKIYLILETENGTFRCPVSAQFHPSTMVKISDKNLSELRNFLNEFHNSKVNKK